MGKLKREVRRYKVRFVKRMVLLNSALALVLTYKNSAVFRALVNKGARVGFALLALRLTC